MNPRGPRPGDAPAEGGTANTLQQRGTDDTTRLAPDGIDASPVRRSPIPLLAAVREQAGDIRARIEANTQRLESTGCLIWTGARNADGRGRMVLPADDRRVYAVVPRVVYVLEHDVEPGDRLVLHGPCDRPECVAIEHLRLGTFADNVADALERGRARIGTNHPHAKLREIDVRFVAERLATHTDAEIADALGGLVCRRTVNSIRHGETWGHVTGITRRRAA